MVLIKYNQVQLDKCNYLTTFFFQLPSIIKTNFDKILQKMEPKICHIDFSQLN